MSNLDQLYRQVILEHYKNPRNKGLIENDKYQAIRIKNPACGDDITIQTLVEEGIIKDIKQEATGCSIACASASILSELLIGKTKEEATDFANEFLKMVSNQPFDESFDFEEAEALAGVKLFPARIKCASIAWVAFNDSLKGE